MGIRNKRRRQRQERKRKREKRRRRYTAEMLLYHPQMGLILEDLTQARAEGRSRRSVFAKWDMADNLDFVRGDLL